MSKFLFKLVFVILGLLVSACRQNTSLPYNMGLIENIYVDNSNIKPIQLIDTLIKFFDIIPLETSNKSLIGSIDRLFYENDRIVVVDKFNAKRIVIFSKTGKFISNISTSGRGPGEFISIGDVRVLNNTIMVFDDVLSKIVKYTLDGKYIKDVGVASFSKYEFVPFGENKALFYNANVPTAFGNFKLIQWSLDRNRFEKGYLKYDEKLEDCNRFFFGDQFFVGSDNSPIKIIEPFNDTVFSFDPKLDELQPSQLLKFKESPIPAGYSYDSSIISKIDDASERNYAFYYGGFGETEKYLIFRYWYADRSHVFVWNKRLKRELINSDFLGFSGLDVILPYNWFLTNDGCLIFYMESTAVIHWLDDQLSRERDTSNNILADVGEKLRDIDNPILLVLNLK
ncbi:6-bladed beta-propeller [Parapedobacter sp. 2B3]|uniref:6-bladed beta-propeller n=1 Tax=Parapedobacter sp. 2B3 TaxID=3342381 RepID=UPI0035B62EC6